MAQGAAYLRLIDADAGAGPAPEGERIVKAGAPLGIAVEAVSKSYGSFAALDDVSLDVGPGEFLTLLGPSGSGKTTLLNIIAGFVRLDRGTVRFGADDVTLLPVNRRGLGMVFQNYALFPHMTVGENVAFSLKVRRLPKAEIRRRVLAVLQLVQLDQLVDRNVAALSGGQRQRVALARAVVFSPKIVLMDEPLSALDKNLREQMQVEIRHLHEKVGATTIYVTHDQREALTMSDRIAVMNRGRIVQCGTPEEIYERPNSAFVAGFIGETALVPVSPCPGGVAMGDGSMLRLPEPAPVAANLFAALRAERVLMPDECGPLVSRFPAVIREVIYQGDSLLILAELAADLRLTIRRPLRGARRLPPPMPGERLMLGIDPAHTVVVAGD